MLNPELKPWNIFNRLNSPVLGITGNVLVDNTEWYNSFMPCFFNLSDVEIVNKLKQLIDDNGSEPASVTNSTIYKEYLTLIEGYSEKVRFRQIVDSLKTRVNKYFNKVESKLFLADIEENNITSLLGFVLAGLNLMQEYMDPVETLTSLKSSEVFTTLDNKLKDLGKLEILNKTPSSEAAYIPMVVLLENKYKSDSLNEIVMYFRDLFEITEESLLESAEFSNNFFKYTKYMSIDVAKKVIDRVANKIYNLENLSPDELAIYKLQQINGIMTWSKYILLNKSKTRRRYDSTNNILYDIKKLDFIRRNKKMNSVLTPKTISGSEKQALLIYLLNDIKRNNLEMFGEIKAKSIEYYEYSII